MNLKAKDLKIGMLFKLNPKTDKKNWGFDATGYYAKTFYIKNICKPKEEADNIELCEVGQHNLWYASIRFLNKHFLTLDEKNWKDRLKQ